MHWKFDATIRDLVIWDASLILRSTSPIAIEVELRRPAPEELDDSEKREQARCTARFEYPAPEGFVDVVGSLPRYLSLSSFAVEPINTQAAINDIRNQLTSSTISVINTVRWKLGMRRPYDPFANPVFSYSFDGIDWGVIGPPLQMPFGVLGFPVSFGESGRAMLQGMLDSQTTEPIAHDLLREAFEIRQTNPRSSLILAVAALEVGIKDCLVRLVENASWLIDNMPMPPVIQILNSYLPNLLSSRPPMALYLPTKEMIKNLERAVEARNTFVHRLPGSKRYARANEQIRFNAIERTLREVDDLLWLLDFYVGFEWAINRVSVSTLQHLIDRGGGGPLPHMK